MGALPRYGPFGGILSERNDAYGEIGDARVAVATQPGQHGALVPRGHRVADVLGIAVSSSRT